MLQYVQHHFLSNKISPLPKQSSTNLCFKVNNLIGNVMFNRLQNFKEQGYILVSIMEREDAIEALKNVLKHFPQFDLSSGDYSKYRKQFECFFYKLAQVYLR